MDKLLGTTTWKEVMRRFTSPVIVVGFIILVLNFLRSEFGWDIPVVWIERIFNYIIYGGVALVGAINNPDKKLGL